MSQETFRYFGKLPPCVRALVWQEVGGMIRRRRITVVIRPINPRYVHHASRRTGSSTFRALGGRHAYIHWTWTCYATTDRFGPPGFTGILGANRESRGEYQRFNPQFLRLENGPVIRFNAARDTIVMDALSLFSLHMYTIVPDHLLPVPTWPTDLQGFHTIQHLETSLGHNRIAGLTPGNYFFGNDTVLAGVKPLVTKLRPSPRALLNPYNYYLPRGVSNKFDEDWDDLLASNRAPTQVAVMNRYFESDNPGNGGLALLDEVDRFFEGV